jgi:serine/threonine-protein kinase
MTAKEQGLEPVADHDAQQTVLEGRARTRSRSSDATMQRPSATGDGSYGGGNVGHVAGFGDYELRELLGRGGMGEVLLAEDHWIGREIAIKRMRRTDPDPDAERRFMREAKIQARLQHPAIVPVHDMGHDHEGRPYFTMKRLAGSTLHDLLDEPQQRLLAAFVKVCLAIEFAHENGVIHRDIKPTNIMLGKFGEVYVLDWGVARVVGDGSASPSIQDMAAAGGEGETQVGEVMGTPGYMPPEQALGYQMSSAVDVYALGCVLFEILTGEPLHPRGAGGAANAIANPTEAPSRRRPQLAIAPELDAACVAALAEDPVDRPRAGELAERIQRYLDGDRDTERRRQLALTQVADAKAALASGDAERRAHAVMSAGRALALDPKSAEAADLVAGLILEPPRELPPALQVSLSDAERDATRVRARTSMIAFASLLSFALVVPFLEIRSWPLVFGFFGAMFGMALISWLSYRRGEQTTWVALISTFITTLLVSRVGGPFVMTPVLTCGIVLGLTTIPKLAARPYLILGWTVLAVVTPVVLEATGVFQSTWSFIGDTLAIRSAVVHGPNRTIEAIALIAVHIALIVMAGNVVRSTSRDRRAAERRLHVQAWHLRQLLPTRSMTPEASASWARLSAP